MITWGAGQRAAAQSGAWGPSQRPARRGGLRAEMHDRRMPESMQHEPWDCRRRPCPPPRSPDHQSAPRVSPRDGPRRGPGPAQLRPGPLCPVLTAKTWATPTLQGHPGA